MAKNYYAVLGVPRYADTAAIQSAFRALARRYHPDTGEASSPGKFRDVIEAYHALRDPAQRRQHDIDLGLAMHEAQRVAEPLFSPRTPLAHLVRRHSNANFDDVFSEIMRLLEAEMDFGFRFF